MLGMYEIKKRLVEDIRGVEAKSRNGRVDIANLPVWASKIDHVGEDVYEGLC